MSTTTASWVTRKCRLAELLNSEGDEDDDGIALDRLLHGQNVIARSSKTTEIEDLRFQSRDMRVLGTLEAGQFGLVDVVNCRLDGTLYVRKSIEKRLALRAPEQCSPLSERTILLEARKLHATWVPHLLCAYQTTTHLAMVMTYEPGGNLWNVFETAPAGVIPESDLLWWMPQIISALFWLHEQGFVHRDVKPHNFVLSETSHIKLIDFGSVAPFDQETRKVESKYCSMMCGTCDYVSPEILRAHEEAFVALEMDSDAERERHRNAYVVYGVETDWWSFGAMIYELGYGVAPFFAKEVRHTYVKITEHQRSLKFVTPSKLSPALVDLLRRLLTDAEFRIGRKSDLDVAQHSLFEIVDWTDLSRLPKPATVHVPEFEYAEDFGQDEAPSSISHGFNFSAFFQSSVDTSPAVSALRAQTHETTKEGDEDSAKLTAPFIGFSWGPPLEAFPSKYIPPATLNGAPAPPPPTLLAPPPRAAATPSPASKPPNFDSFVTPMRQTSRALKDARLMTPYQTLPRSNHRPGASTIKRRQVDDVEAMQQLAACVGMSARKKVMDSGRKPRVLLTETFYRGSGGNSVRTTNGSGSLRKRPSAPDFSSGFDMTPASPPPLTITTAQGRTVGHGGWSETEDEGLMTNPSDSDTHSLPPSPSPTPRPGSSMSMTMTMTMTGGGTTSTGTSLSSLMRRSGTPTATYSGTFLSQQRRLSNPPPLEDATSTRMSKTSTGSLGLGRGIGRKRSSTLSVTTGRRISSESIPKPPTHTRSRARSSSVSAEPKRASKSPVEMDHYSSQGGGVVVLDELEERHENLMDEIGALEESLNELLKRLERET